MRADVSRIEAIYAKHPLRAESVLARIRSSSVETSRVREFDLAIDTVSQVTDQNHVGGAAGVRELARQAAVISGDRVVDIGCGLGGPARILAEEFGALVDAIELTETRFQDAVRLTALVGLEGRVHIIHGDFLNLPLPARHYDVAWGQAAWVHFPNLRVVFARCAEILKPRGRIALEEAYLRRQAKTPDEVSRLKELEDCWAAYLVDQEEWTGAAEGHNFRVTAFADQTLALAEELEILRGAADRGPAGAIPANETRGWDVASKLIQDGILGYFRLIAQLVQE